MHIRWMIRRDMQEVLEIEKASFEFPWSEEDYIRCLRQRNCIGMVAEHDEQVVGFMFYELHKNQLHVLNFAVHPEHRRIGIGRAMIEKLLGKLSSGRRSKITLEVRESNLGAQLFFRNFDFRVTSTLKGHYEDSKDDAYVMKYRLGSSEDFEPENRIKRLAND